MPLSPLFLIHAFSVVFMTGLIWLVQWVEYPLFSFLSAETFQSAHQFHSNRITWIVGPAMLTQLVTSVALVTQAPDAINPVSLWICLGLTVSVFLATALLSVPAHTILASGFNEAAHQRLVLTNWIRTLCWSAHSGLCFFILLNTHRTSL